MEIKAKLKYLHISPRKVRLVADLLRGKDVKKAKAILDFTIKRAALPLRKLLNSAVANAWHNHRLKEDELYIQEINVNEGPRLKRYRARAQGQAYTIQKRSSHVSLVLGLKDKKSGQGRTKEGLKSQKLSEENKKPSSNTTLAKNPKVVITPSLPKTVPSAKKKLEKEVPKKPVAGREQLLKPKYERLKETQGRKPKPKSGWRIFRRKAF